MASHGGRAADPDELHIASTIHIAPIARFGKGRDA
jgi:hypothetical protein